MGTIEILTVSGFAGRKNDVEKLWIGLVLFWIVFLVGCGPKLEPSFEGIFVNVASSEFSEASDTLRVEKIGDLDYVLYRSTGIVLIDGQGKKAKPIIQKETWKLQLDKDRNLLLERSKGREIRVDDDALRLENAAYHRLP